MADVEQYLSASQRKRQKRTRYLRIAAFGVGLAMFLWGIAYAVVASPLFRLKEVTFTGAIRLREEDALTFLRAHIASGRFGALLGIDNILSWPDAVDEEKLRLFLPAAKSFQIEKHYGKRALAVAVAERERYGIWCFQKALPFECAWFDDEGIIFEKAFAAEGSLLVVVNDYSQEKKGIGRAVLPENFIKNLFSIFRVLSRTDLRIKEIRLNDITLQEMEARTLDGPDIRFSLRFSSDNALEVIRTLQQREDFSTLEYVDFRTENRAYYK